MTIQGSKCLPWTCKVRQGTSEKKTGMKGSMSRVDQYIATMGEGTPSTTGTSGRLTKTTSMLSYPRGRPRGSSLTHWRMHQEGILFWYFQLVVVAGRTEMLLWCKKHLGRLTGAPGKETDNVDVGNARERIWAFRLTILRFLKSSLPAMPPGIWQPPQLAEYTEAQQGGITMPMFPKEGTEGPLERVKASLCLWLYSTILISP